MSADTPYAFLLRLQNYRRRLSILVPEAGQEITYGQDANGRVLIHALPLVRAMPEEKFEAWLDGFEAGWKASSKDFLGRLTQYTDDWKKGNAL
jgi:hypothetical protein